MLLVHPEKQESEQDQDDHPNPAVAALFGGIGGLRPRGRMRNRQRLVHRLLLLECQVSKHSDYQQYFLIRKMACGSRQLPSRHAVRPVTESPLNELHCVWFQSGMERAECDTPQLTLPRARMVLDGRNYPANSCSQALAEPARKVTGTAIRTLSAPPAGLRLRCKTARYCSMGRLQLLL
jgi:hypothetical protein